MGVFINYMRDAAFGITARRLKQLLLHGKMIWASYKGLGLVRIFSVYQYLSQDRLKIVGGERKQIYQRFYLVLTASLGQGKSEGGSRQHHVLRSGDNIFMPFVFVPHSVHHTSL